MAIGNATFVENALLDSSVGGSISVVGGQQRDTVVLGRTTVAGSFAAALGAGSSYTGIRRISKYQLLTIA